MKSEREKREEEIQRLIQGAGLKQEPDPAFEEEIKRAAAAIVEEEARKVQTEQPDASEQPPRRQGRKSSIEPKTAGVLLLVLGAVLTFSMPGVGAMLMLCGIAAIVWTAVQKSSKK